MLGHEPRRFGSIHWKKMNDLASQAIKRLGIEVDVSQPLGNYSVAIQQMVAIARALDILSAKVLILDEPTSSLDIHETNLLFDVMRKLKSEGLGIVFITHFLDQVYQIADRITVLRNGKLVGTFETASLPRVELIAKMLGRSLTDLDAMSRVKLEGEQKKEREHVVEAKGLGRTGSLAPIDLELNIGEVVGVAGLLGSGRTEMAGLIFGIDTPDTGSLTVHGEKVSRFSPLESLKRGIALCPEDRKAEGVVGDLTIRENIILALQARYGWFKFLNRQKQNEIAQQYIQLLGIVTPSAEQLVKNLSGGNQQKVILARWLATSPQVLILDEPTRGIDVGAKAEIQKLVLDLAEEGKSCVFISSELEEVLRVSHRIVVLRDRKKAAEYVGTVDDQTIIHTMAGNL
jgi:monosaccharide-transporting ATPase